MKNTLLTLALAGALIGNDAGGLGRALAHLAALIVGWSLLARAALQRFA